MSRQSVTLAILVAALLSVAGILSSRNTATAGHNAWWVEVRAPFSGTWNLNGAAPPTSHSIGALPGDWATDYYASQGTEGRWYSVTSNGALHSARVGPVSNACNKPNWSDAGLRYRIDLRDGAGQKFGHFGYVHVDPRPPSGGQYWLGEGSQLSQAMLIGYTRNYTYQSGCWEADANSVHWHILGYNDWRRAF